MLLEQRPKSNIWTGRVRIIHRCSGLIKCGDCTPHRIYRLQLDQIVYDGLQRLRNKVIAESKEYEKIIKDWVKKKTTL